VKRAIPFLALTCLTLAGVAALAGVSAAAAANTAAQSTPPAGQTAAPAPTPTPEPKPCTGPEYRQLDFWIGDWDLTHRQRVARDKDQWQDGKATNSIRPILDGCVIEEHFSDAGQGFVGQSVSMYNPALKKWQQTWVDNSNEYLDFTGNFTGSGADGKMILSRPAKVQGKDGFQRMVFRDIKPDSFDWDWENSIDGGKTWVTMWKIHYNRRK